MGGIDNPKNNFSKVQCPALKLLSRTASRLRDRGPLDKGYQAQQPHLSVFHCWEIVNYTRQPLHGPESEVAS